MKPNPENHNQQDYKDVSEAVFNYVYGVATNDWPRIQKAYDVPKAQMKLITGDPGAEKVFVIPIEQVWEKIWSTLPKNPNHTAEILNISVHEGRIALVTLNNNNKYFDVLSLYKVNDSWKIYDKLTRMLDGGYIPEADLIAAFGQQQ